MAHHQQHLRELNQHLHVGKKLYHFFVRGQVLSIQQLFLEVNKKKYPLLIHTHDSNDKLIKNDTLINLLWQNDIDNKTKS